MDNSCLIIDFARSLFYCISESDFLGQHNSKVDISLKFLKAKPFLEVVIYKGCTYILEILPHIIGKRFAFYTFEVNLSQRVFM